MKKWYIYLGFIFILIWSCQKELTIDNNITPPAEDTTGLGYYRATIDTRDYEVVVTGTNTNQMFSLINGNEQAELISGVSNPLPDGSSLIVVKGVFPEYDQATEADLKSFFAPGEYSLQANDLQVIIAWNDESGSEWASISDNADQTGSKFKIISVKDARDSNGKYYVQVIAEFNCNLYDIDGNMIVLTNGRFKGNFGPVN